MKWAKSLPENHQEILHFDEKFNNLPYFENTITYILIIDDTADNLQWTVAVKLWVVFPSAGIPYPVPSILSSQYIRRGAFRDGCALDNPGFLAKMKEIVAQQDGMLFFITLKHLEELLCQREL